MPVGTAIQPGGDADVIGEAFTQFGTEMGAGILLVYGVLVVLFSSFLTPITILKSLPLAIGGYFRAPMAVAVIRGGVVHRVVAAVRALAVQPDVGGAPAFAAGLGHCSGNQSTPRGAEDMNPLSVSFRHLSDRIR